MIIVIYSSTACSPESSKACPLFQNSPQCHQLCAQTTPCTDPLHAQSLPKTRHARVRRRDDARAMEIAPLLRIPTCRIGDAHRTPSPWGEKVSLRCSMQRDGFISIVRCWSAMKGGSWHRRYRRWCSAIVAGMLLLSLIEGPARSLFDGLMRSALDRIAVFKWSYSYDGQEAS